MIIHLRKSFIAIVALLLALTVIFSTAAANADAASADTYRIIALGDSISAGYEHGMEEIEKPVPYAYVDRLYEQALFRNRAELMNYAIMGLTSTGLLNLLQGAADAKLQGADFKPLNAADLQDFSTFHDRVSEQANSIAAQAPQLGEDLADADLIVLTIGANDFGPIINAAKNQPEDVVRQIIQDSFLKTMNDYTKNLDNVMTALHKLAPHAQIVIADQYSPLWDSPLWGSLRPELLKAVENVANELDLFAKTMNDKGIPLSVAHISTEFVNNERKFANFNQLTNFDTHPTQAGYEAIAQVFAKVIWGEYLKPAPRAADVPLSVIINGVEPPNKPTVIKSTTFLAIRDVANAVGADLKWVQKTQTAIFMKNGREVVIDVGANFIKVNGVVQPLDTPAYFQKVGKETKTYVPLAVISKGLDYQVVYRNQSKIAFINS